MNKWNISSTCEKETNNSIRKVCGALPQNVIHVHDNKNKDNSIIHAQTSCMSCSHIHEVT
jgi:hypothetical protein